MVKVSVVPDITFRGRVKNYGGDGREIGEEMKEFKMFNSPITLDIPDEQARTLPMLKGQLRQRFKKLIRDTIEENLYKDVKRMAVGEEEGSPPQLIVIPDDYFLEDDADVEKFLKSITRATFTILTTSNYPSNVYFGSERVWDKTAPIYTALGQGTNYEGTDDKLTCAYDYLINQYSKNRSVKKYTTAYNTTGKRGNKTTGKDIIDYWVSLPYQEQKDIFNLWKVANQDSIYIRDIITSGSLVYPLQEEIGLQDLDDDLFKVELQNIDPKYSEEEEEETLTILDLVKWCICADVRLIVRDYNGQHYLGYNPADFKHTYIKPSHRPAIVVRVENQHAYFETDGKKIQSKVLNDNNKKNQSLHYDELRPPNKKGQNKEKQETEDKKEKKKELETEYIFDDTLHYSPELPHQYGEMVDLSTFTKYDWTSYRDDFVNEILSKEAEGWYDYCNERNNRIRGRDIKNYDCDDFIELCKKEDKQRVIHLDRANLNKVAVDMLVKHSIKHDASVGGLHTIKQLTYNTLTLIARSKAGMDKETPCISKAWAKVYETYPELRKASGVVPTPKCVGDYLYSLLDKEPMLSTMSGQLRSIFYDCEIKPENVDKHTYFYEKPVISFDIKKAYTTALETNQYRWNVYDCVSQPTKFSGSINPNWFYLAYPISTDYPVKQGGLMLYHGSLVRHLKGKVDIKYQIEPVRQLEPEFYKEFVERVKWEVKKGVFKGIYNFKQIINSYIGGLKKKDGLNNYYHHLTKDKTTISRILSQGKHPVRVEGSEYWIIPNGWKHTFYQTGQPIRLQVIDMINEQMYLFSKWAEKVFKYPALSIRTDACYIQTKYDDDESASLVIPELLDRGWNDDNDFQFEVEKTLNKVEYNRIRFSPSNKPINHGFKFMPNRWTTNIIVDKKWSREVGAKLLCNTIIHSGGCMLEGFAGRGKSELITCLTKMCRKNYLKYLLYKECLRLAGVSGRYDKCEEYRKKHPCFMRCFAPTNKASNRIKGKTLHKGLGIAVKNNDDVDDEEDDEVLLTEAYTDKIIDKFKGDGKDRDAIDLAVFDEVSMCNGEMISYISYMKQKCPHLKVLMCGDLQHQLPPVGEEHRNFAGAYVLKEICNFNRMELKYNFRMDTQSDKLWDEWSIKPERFRPTSKKTTQRNLCRYNATRKKVINLLQDKIPNPLVIKATENTGARGHTNYTKIGIGTPMIALITQLDRDIAKNEMWYVVSITDGIIKLWNNDTEEKFVEEDEETILKSFQSGYCITIHKSQGETYDDEYTIWDWRKMAMDRSSLGRRLRYVAQSRSKDPENKIFYQL